MTLTDKFVDYVREQAENGTPGSWEKMVLGFQANKLKTKLLPNRHLSKGYQKLEAMMMSFVADCLRQRGSYVWGNIFAPCEIMYAAGLSTLSIEVLACYFSGYHLESYFIDCAQNQGIAPTLCSYHKTFVGAITSGLVPCPDYAVTTSLSCDGNLNTFRFLEKKTGTPFTLLDVPYDGDPLSVEYLADQLRDLSRTLGEKLGRPVDEEKLKETIRIENETRKELLRFFQFEQEYYYPGELICQLYLMMAVHLMMGRPEFLKLMQFMNEDIQTYPKFTGKKLLWVHLIPYYQETLRQYFSGNEKYQVIASDIVIDFDGQLDETDPYRALAEKTIRNMYNGAYAKKAEAIGRIVSDMKPDGVIHFCHWGCKQADGGSLLLKEEMQKMGVPMLILDGDGIDKRNSHDGQIKTRLEAFLEMIGTEEKS